MLAPLAEAVPPSLYGGTERVVANLCQGLTDLGHQVDLFASGDSTAKARLHACCPRALRLAGVPYDRQTPYQLAQLAKVLAAQDTFDVIHSHNDVFGMLLTAMGQTPVLTTLHGRLDLPELADGLAAFPKAPLVSISMSQRRPLPQAFWAANIPHGIDLTHLPFTAQPGHYLAFLGRLSPEKRPDLAIRIAHLSGVPLKIAAKVDPTETAYFAERIAPLIDGSFIQYVGEIDDAGKGAFLGGALGLVFPIDWPEPFGLAPIEAWATGTPVLARPVGSVPELHRDGVTGFVRESIDELAALVPALATFDRARCRAHVERHFTIRRMCEDYLDVYQRLCQPAGNARAAPVQSDQPPDYRRRVLHPVVRPDTGHREGGAQGQ